MAKRIRVSSDGTNFFTLPGSSGEFRIENNAVDDTVFGQTFESNEPSLGQWNISANAKWKGVAGYQAVLKKSGTSTAMTTEATTQIGATKSYQITAPARRVIDYNTALTVFDNGVDQTAELFSVDYLFGLVTFKPGYTVTGPVTVTGNYLPLGDIARARSFNLTQTAAEIDETDYETARSNGGLRVFSPGLRTANIEVGGVFSATNDYDAAVLARGLVIIDVTPDNSTSSIFRGFFKAASKSQSGDVGALEEETVTYNLWVPDGELVVRPFGWALGSGSGLNQAVRRCIEAWQNETNIDAQYLPNGTTGKQGSAIVTEISLANQMEGLNEFTVNLRGSGGLTTVS